MIDVDKVDMVQQLVFAVDEDVFEDHEVRYMKTSEYFEKMAAEIRYIKNQSIKVESYE